MRIKIYVYVVLVALVYGMLWTGCSNPEADEATPRQDAGAVRDQGRSQDRSAPVDRRLPPDRAAPADHTAPKDERKSDQPLADRTPPKDNTKPDTKPAGVTYHKDVRPIMVGRCETCHVKGGVGPFELNSYQKTYALRTAVKKAVIERTMPPWQAARGCTDYKGNYSLTEAEIKTIKTWVETGAKEGDPADYKPKAYDKPKDLERVDVSIKTPIYTPTKRPDEYRCFIMKWPYKTTKYITGYQVKPGNKKIAHHMIAYLGEPSKQDYYQKRDARVPGPGYNCFGGPGGGSALGTPWLGVWAPGAPAVNLPKGTGLRVEPGSTVIIQMHYNVWEKNPAPDQTTVEFSIADKVTQEGYMVPYTNPLWLRRGGMKIPKGDSKKTHSFEADLTAFTKRTFKIYDVMLHMHTLGKSGKLFVRDPSGKEQCLLNLPKWDFNWQLIHRLNKPFVLKPGQSLGITCTWDNSQANQPVVDGKKLQARDVYWGEGTQDEMCLGVFYALCTDSSGKSAKCLSFP